MTQVIRVVQMPLVRVLTSTFSGKTPVIQVSQIYVGLFPQTVVWDNAGQSLPQHD